MQSQTLPDHRTNLSVYGYVPDPEQTEVERLRARVAELEAQQAQAVSLEDAADQFAVADDDPAGVVLGGAR